MLKEINFINKFELVILKVDDDKLVPISMVASTLMQFQ